MGPQSTAPTGATARPGIDPLAIVSLVAALLWVVGLGSIVAIVCGVIVLRRGAVDTSRTLAIIGLVIGIVGLLPAILLLVAFVGLVSFSSSVQDEVASAELESDLRSASIAQETVFTMEGSYTDDLGELERVGGHTARTDLQIAWADEGGFCMEAHGQNETLHVTDGVLDLTDGPCP